VIWRTYSNGHILLSAELPMDRAGGVAGPAPGRGAAPRLRNVPNSPKPQLFAWVKNEYPWGRQF